MSDKISRRQFLAALGGSLGALGLTGIAIFLHRLQQHSQEIFITDQSIRVPTEPIIRSTPKSPEPESVLTDQVESSQEPEPILEQPSRVDFGPRAIHVYASSATNWSGVGSDYWNYVDQTVVDQMVDEGIRRLTEAPSPSDGWRILVQDYQPSDGIAIKVNFNNSFTCSGGAFQIDALIHPINAIIRGLKEIGIQESDIWVYDAIRRIPDRFVDACLYSNVRFFDNGCRNAAMWSSGDPDAFVDFNLPAGIPNPNPVRISDVVINAKYLINVPIMKNHSLAGITLGFKNHFGTIRNPGDLHEYISLSGNYFRTTHSALVDLYRNPHIQRKTILILGDGLFGAKRYTDPPAPWATFSSDFPNSFFFSRDPVAIDCIMADLLAAETGIPADSDRYLHLASDAGLGVYERGDPWAEGYKNIEYIHFDL